LSHCRILKRRREVSVVEILPEHRLSTTWRHSSEVLVEEDVEGEDESAGRVDCPLLSMDEVLYDTMCDLR
jgi:hypothetical protein